MTGGKLFVEAVATSGWRINGPQTVFFRQVNCEQDPSNSVDDNGTPTYVLNSGATIWAFGLKSERELTTITTRNGGKTEVLSGLQYPAREGPSTTPLFIVENASASFSYGTESFWIGGDYQIQARYMGVPRRQTAQPSSNGHTTAAIVRSGVSTTTGTATIG